jgi:hypothetical protein
MSAIIAKLALSDEDLRLACRSLSRSLKAATSEAREYSKRSIQVSLPASWSGMLHIQSAGG